MKKKHWLFSLLLLPCAGVAQAHVVEVATMNNADKILKVQNKATGEFVNTDNKNNYTYTLNMDPGVHEFSMYSADGETFLGALEWEIPDQETQPRVMLYLGTVIVNNTHEDGTPWKEGVDYTVSTKLETLTGKERLVTRSSHNEKGQISFVVKNAASLSGVATPSAENMEKGYMEFTAVQSITNNCSLKLTMPMGVIANVSVPADAQLQIGTKVAHFVDFALYEPLSETVDGVTKTISYRVLPDKQINYRVWREGSLTRAGYFPSGKEDFEMEFTEDDLAAFSPKEYNQNVKSNQGYETGDIFVNGNERGHISLSVGDTFEAHAMRTWQLTDTSTANYFMEPDFHYTVIGLDGKPLDGVLELTSKPGSAWTEIKAVAPGTAIVLVTYDAIGVNYYQSGTRQPYMGGEIWGAIWPENTAVYVVTVGEETSQVVPQMFINEEYNTGTLKVAGKNVDAEHDVFYYLDTEEGYTYTFSPENVEAITIAYPEISETEATYNGFTADGVTKNADGSWSLLLRHGRQIVKMTDANGNASYQVMRARRCHRDIVNVTRPESKIYQPGDQVKIQYSGLFHPANKLAGIYNMSAYVTYNGVPNGTDLILGASQYTFGSAPTAQAVTITIPSDYNIEENPEISFSDGVLQVNGYGDPIGNHRFIDPEKGRNANFAAQAHKTYFGAIPDVSIPVTPYKSLKVDFVPNVKDVTLSVVHKGEELTPDENGQYIGTIGTYSVTAKKAGYYCLRQDFTVEDNAEGLQTFAVNLTETPAGAWDGVSMTRPQTENGVYNITTGAELAWFANEMNSNTANENAKLGADIDLADYEWTPIGTSSNEYKGTFDGNGHTVSHVYINYPKADYQGFFSYVGENGVVTSLTLDGEIIGRNYAGSIAGRVAITALVDRCANYATINASSYSAGLVGYVFNGGKLTNSLNAGTVNCPVNGAGLAGMIWGSAVENLINIADVNCGSNASALTGRFTTSSATNVFVNKDYELKGDYTVVNDEQLATGEIAYLLGEAFGQTIGTDEYPVVGGKKVYKVNYYLIDDSAISLMSDEETETLYTNGELPSQLNGEDVEWYADAEMLEPVSAIESDATLYAKKSISTGINSLTNDEAAQWFNLEGIEIAAPSKGVHGIFIRVVNGKAEKIRL